MSKQRCIVYGGGGFIGSHLCEELLQKGFDVTVFDKINFSGKNISGFKKDITVIEGDFNNENDIESSLSNVDYVYHLVSSTLPANSNDNPVYDVETNLVSSLRLFNECVNKKIKKVIFLSSGGTVYGMHDPTPIIETDPTHPISSYGIVKKTIEDYLFMFEKIYGLDYAVFRLSNPYGERQNPQAAQGIIPVFIRKVIRDEPLVIWGDGKIERDYIYIKDAVEVLASAVTVNHKERIFNLSSGKGHTINDIVDHIKKISGKKVNTEFQTGRKVDVQSNVLDNSLVKKVFDWKPRTSLEEGMTKVYKYLKDNDR